MDSWYVELLLRTRKQIRSSIHTIISDPFLRENLDEANLEDDTYNDLLMVEKKLKDLELQNLLSKQEIVAVNRIIMNKQLSQAEGRTFRRLCDRIAYMLGEHFTNEGYLDYMATKYKLTEEQTEIARNFMNSKEKYHITLIKKGKTK